MGALFWQNPRIHIHDTDFSGYLHKVTAPKISVAELDSTVFGASYVTRIGGLKDAEFSGEGFWDSPPDAAAFAALGVADRVVTICPQGAETNTAYMFQMAEFDYQAFEAIGNMIPLMVGGKSSNGVGVVRGQLAKAVGSVSATGQLGSILTMTGPSSSQFLYATLHVLTAATTITVQVQSATLVGFGSPTTRGTIGPITAAGGTWLVRVAGPITDGFWRLNVSAITGTFSVAGAIGIQ